ncbi:MAG TPA: SpoIIE family protein phosphatase [Syntrophales bacterium]|nr:SpoIIE family protein phosphatase [Syntrophales bacterium]
MATAQTDNRGTAGGKGTILIVDDHPVNIRLLERILGAAGYRTLAAENGPDGRGLAVSRLPDLVLLDIMMPGESGFESCEKLKKDPRTAHIPVIFLSAKADVESKVTGLNLGAVDYMTKPFDKTEVLARVCRHLETRDAYQTIIELQAAKLKQVHEAQQAILPRPVEFPGALFGVNYIPIIEAGGDFYDVFPVADGVFGYFAADISGHDIRASYNTFALKALISQNIGPQIPPEETMRVINQVFTSLMKNGEHLTGVYARLDRRVPELTVVNAGHLPVLYLNRDGAIRPLAAEGDILGVFEDVIFEPLCVKVRSGDRFFLFTDGLLEVFGEDPRSREEGLDALMACCVDTRDLPIDKAVDEIVSLICPDRKRLQDDVLLLGAEV